MFEERSNAEQAWVWALDDENDVLLSLGALLEDAGFGFRGFLDADAFFEAHDESGESRPDLILVDLNLPGKSGVEVIREVRAGGSDVPIVVLTAMVSEGALLNAFESGADDVVRKPYSLSELLARLNWQLHRAESERALRQRNSDLQILTELAQTLSRETALGPILQALEAGVSRALEGGAGAFFLVDRKQELVQVGGPEGTRKTLDLRGLDRARDALARRERVTFVEDEAAQFAKALGFPEGPESAALVPLVLGDMFLGFLALTFRQGTIEDDRTSSFVQTVADYAAVAIHRSSLFQSVVQESSRIDEANSELARIRDFLFSVIDSSPDAIVVSDRKGQIVVFNAAAETFLGIPRKEAIGSDVRRLYPDGGAGRVMRMLLNDKWGGRGRLESHRIDVLDADGDRVPVMISATLMESEGEETATVGVFTDLRKQLRMEQELQEANESLERTRRQALIAELAGAAAHELNQPLTSMLGYAELLDSKIPEDDPNRRAFETILAESQRMAEIVRKIGRITQYKTKEYVGGARIFDLDQASEVEEEGGSLAETTSVMTTREAERPPHEEEP